jgi:heme-degrading monooxygenase HmoA
MTQEVIELAQIKLAEGKNEQDLTAASDAFQRDFLNGQDGFLSRHLVRRAQGSYLDIIHWESREKADAVFAQAQKSEAAGLYFTVMKFDAQSDDPGVEHCSILRSFSAT